MVYNSMEMDYLLSLLKAVLNNEAAGDTGPRHDWSLLFNISSYHRVQTMICYALLFNESMPPEWRERYGARFRELVTKDAAYRKMVHGILEMLEKDDIPSVLLPPQEVRGLYPQSDMREVDGLSLLVREDRVGKLFQTMYAGGFRYEGESLQGGYRFVASDGWHITAYVRLFRCDRKMERLFANLWERIHRAEGDNELYCMDPEDRYLLMVCWSAVRFSLSQADIRDAVDIYLYLQSCGQDLNWTYIDQRLAECDVLDFSRGLRALAWLWFAKFPREIKNDGYLDMEEYILSKGMYAREACMKFLPLMGRLEIWKIKEERKARVLAVLHWLFPQRKYMIGLYPVLEHHPWLLWFCWIRRLIHIPFRRLRQRVERAAQSLFFLISPYLERILSLWERRGRAAKEEESGQVGEDGKGSNESKSGGRI